ncbi:hypothetical protein GF354_05980 [Candidatus Peregrinibacteria bacterium]|nr:hypothetical protein [Candidatus Peregrinibacteria bacterium]
MKKIQIVIAVFTLIVLTACIEVNTDQDTPDTKADEEASQSENITEPETENQNDESGSEVINEPESEEELTESDYYLCENNKFPFNSENHGQFSITGEVFILNAPEPWTEDETIDYIKMKVSEFSSPVAEKYFMDLAEKGNTINLIEGDSIIFAIGTYEDQIFKSTAEISDQLKNEIISATDSGEELTLDLTVPYFPGRGAPPEFTFACRFE